MSANPKKNSSSPLVTIITQWESTQLNAYIFY